MGIIVRFFSFCFMHALVCVCDACATRVRRVQPLVGILRKGMPRHSCVRTEAYHMLCMLPVLGESGYCMRHGPAPLMGSRAHAVVLLAPLHPWVPVLIMI